MLIFVPLFACLFIFKDILGQRILKDDPFCFQLTAHVLCHHLSHLHVMQRYTDFPILDFSVMFFAQSLHQDHPLQSRVELCTLEFQHLLKEEALMKTISFREGPYFYAYGIVGICEAEDYKLHFINV